MGGLRIVADEGLPDLAAWFVERGHRIDEGSAPSPGYIALTGVPVGPHPGAAFVIAFERPDVPATDVDVDQVDLMLASQPSDAMLRVAEQQALQATGAPRHPFARAADQLMAAISTDPNLLPSVYLRRGDRLRCVAVRGYHQIMDGLPVGRGIAGTVATSGVAQIIGDVEEREDFLAAQANLRSEVCLPLRHDGVVVGVFNVESPDRPTADLVGRCQDWADRLEQVLESSGGPPPPTIGERVGVYAERLASADTSEMVADELLDAALDLSTLSTAVLIVEIDGIPTVAAGAGPLAERFSAASAAELSEMRGWVADATACYSHRSGPEGWLTWPVLRRAGVRSVAVVHLRSTETSFGVLLCADERPVAQRGSRIESLEVLASIGANAMEKAASVHDLSIRALRDPLTGVGNRHAFERRLQSLAEQPLDGGYAIAVIDVDRFKEINDEHGHQAGDRVLLRLATSLGGSLGPEDGLYRIGGDEFAAIVAVEDAAGARRLGERLRSAAHAVGQPVSIGVATAAGGDGTGGADGGPAQVTDPRTLLELADQALYTVKRTGRDAVQVATT